MTGFDAVIGNPPYVAKRKITDYTYQGFDTDNCPDIYAPCMERAATLVKPQGGYAMIVPLSFQYSNRLLGGPPNACGETPCPLGQ